MNTTITTDNPPTITVSMARKINLGNYESADCFVSINGITEGMTEEEMLPLLDTGKVAWDLVRAALTEQMRMVRGAPIGPVGDEDCPTCGASYADPCPHRTKRAKR